MKRCPGCAGERHYLLGDGRLKCSACARRFSWTSSWDSVRLPAATKQRLLDTFARGTPCHRIERDASAVSRERFYRVLRACCAWSEAHAATSGRGVACLPVAHAPDARLLFGLVERSERVEAVAVDACDRQSIVRGIEAHAHGGALYYTDAWQAYVALDVRGHHVAIPREERTPVLPAHARGIAGFWRCARRWLRPYRRVPLQYFHLYLSEACYRYNHRHEDLARLILELARSVSIQELRPVLERPVQPA